MSGGTVRARVKVPKRRRAGEGERICVLLNHIKADKRVQFEHFVHDILAPAARRAEPEVFRQIRVLHPVEPNEDGTFTYVFLVDPLTPDADYSFEYPLYQVYPPEEAEQLLRLAEESYASPQVELEVIQSGW